MITPLFLVAGTFFPIDQLPEGFQIAAQFNPLYQLVELVRGAAFGFEAVDLLRVVGLVAFSLRDVAARRAPDDPPAGRLAALHSPMARAQPEAEAGAGSFAATPRNESPTTIVASAHAAASTKAAS